MWQGEADDLMLLHQPPALPLCALVPSAFLWAVGVSKVQHVYEIFNQRNACIHILTYSKILPCFFPTESPLF